MLKEINEKELTEMIGTVSLRADAKLLIDFQDLCEISLENFSILASIYMETLEHGIETHFHSVPMYFRTIFPDILNIDSPTPPSYSGYHLVLVYRHGKFNRVCVNPN